MKLKRFTDSKKIERVSIGFKSSTLADLKAYADFYQQETGDSATLSALVQQIVCSFMSDDREFARVKAQGRPVREIASGNRIG
ncbi:MAG: DUF2274 domain-containing protein [Thiogranum sp.]|nr:DUF2274 domain-containing protein [Thiogranum sp.]